MEFTEQDDEIFCEWIPDTHHQGFYNILHGGIQATLMDEIAAWTVQVKLRTAGVTTKMEVDYIKPVFTNRGHIQLRARIDTIEKRIAVIRVDLYNSDLELCSSANVSYFTYPEGIAGKRLFYPGYEAFFMEEEEDGSPRS